MRQTLFAWNARTGMELWRKSLNNRTTGVIVGAAGYGIQPLAKIPNTNLIAFGNLNGISTLDPVTGRTETLLEELETVPKSLDVSPDGTLFAVGGPQRLVVVDRNANTIYAIENQPEEPLENNFNHRDRLRFGGDFSYGRFSPDGQYLALVNSEQPETIQLLDAVTGNQIREIQGNARIVRIDFSPDSRRIAATERDIAARLYDVSTGQRLWELLLPQAGSSESYTSCVAFRPDGKQIAVGAPLGSDHRIRLVDPTTGNETGSLSGSSWKPWTMHYTQDNRTLFGSGWDGMIRRWDLNTNEQLPHPGGVRASSVCAMSRDEHLMSFVDDQQDIHLVSLPSGESVHQLNRPNTEWDQIAFSYDGTQIAAGGRTLQEIHVVIWNVASQIVQHEWSWPKGDDSHAGVEALAWSEDGARIAAASFRQDAAYVWDLPTDRRICDLKHRNVYGMDINSAGTQLVTAGWDKHIRVWDCDSEKPLKDIEVTSTGDANDTRMYGVKLSNDESLIAAVDMTQSIRVFNRQLEPVNVIGDCGSFTYGALQFSGNDQWIAVGTHSGVRIYDVTSSELLWEADDHEKYIYTVDFGANDNTLLSGGSDGVCYLWALEIPRSNEPNGPDQLYEQLVGASGQAAFQAFLQLSRKPESTVSLLSEKLTKVKLADIPDSEFRKAFLTLGARNAGLREKAQRQFHEWGLSAYERLMTQAKSRPLGEMKQEFAKSFGRKLATRYDRAARLLIQIDSAAARDAAAHIQSNSPSTLIRDTIRRARGSGS